MGIIWDASKILFLLLTLLGLAFENHIDIVLVVIIISLYTLIRGVIRSSRGIKKTTYVLIETSTIIIILFFLINNQGSILDSIILISELFGEGLAMFLELFSKGYINIIHLIIFGGALLFLWAFGKKMGSSLVSNTFTIGMSITAFIIFIGVYSKDFNSALNIFISFLPMLIVLGGLYFIVKGVLES